MGQVQKVKRTTKPAETESEPTADTPADQTKAEKLKADLDAILDEIEEALETNAVDMVAEYIQRGGQ